MNLYRIPWLGLVITLSLGGISTAAEFKAVATPPPQTGVVGPQPHFTFTVPVRLSNLLPEVTGVLVFCLALNERAQEIGRGQTDVPFDSATGSSSQNVIVRVNANPGQDPSAARRYNCHLYVHTPQGGFPAGPNHPGSGGRPAPGTRVEPFAGGDIPQ